MKGSLLFLPLLLTSCFWNKGDLDVKPIPSQEARGRELPLEALVDWKSLFSQDSSANKSGRKKPQNPKDLESELKTKLRKNGADNKTILLDLATFYLGQNQIESCLFTLADLRDRLVKSDDKEKPLILSYRYVLAVANLKQGKIEKGRQILQELVGQNKMFLPAYAALAVSYLNQGKFQAADFILTKARDLAGEDATILSLQALAKEGTGETSQAKALLDQALDLDSQNLEALILAASLKIKNKDMQGIRPKLEKIFAISYQNAKAYILLGLVFVSEKKFEDAKISYQKAIALDNQDVYARLNLAFLELDHFGNSQEAARLFTELLQIENTPSQLQELARSYLADIRA